MKYPQQLDAHIKSYKRERIRKLLQTFREQKELLTLSEEPVKKIRYKISFPETSAIIALLPKKPDILKFPPVEYKKIKKVTPPVFSSQIYSNKVPDVSIKTATANINSKIFPDNVKIPVPYYKKTEIKTTPLTFKGLNYKYRSPDINPEKITANINSKIFPDNVKIPVLYYKKTEIKTTPLTFKGLNYKYQSPDINPEKITANINSKIFPDNVKIPVPYYKKTEIKTTPLTFKGLNYKHQSPDINPEKFTANINLYKNKVQFKTPNQNITLPVLKTSAIDFGKINFKNNFNTAELNLPEIPKTTYQNIKFDTNTEINIPPVKKKNFRLPDLDFSDTLEKLKNAIIKDMGKYNEE